ncbi:hypothetical protein JVU11DRAFT_11367 [Chiua virens]|nr:hypothetical protein JVU11DRAFT_11367 [Chiua virens]
MTHSHSTDTIRIHELLLPLSISNVDVDDKETRLHDVLISLSISHDISRTAHSDDLTYSIDYAAIYTELVRTLPEASYTSLEGLADHVFETAFRTHPDVHDVVVVVTLRDTSPNFTVEMARRRDHGLTSPSKFTINGLVFPAIIGINPRERTEKQPLGFDIIVQRPQKSLSQEYFPLVGLSTSIREMFDQSQYLTLEALSSAAACHILAYTQGPEDKVTVKTSKPEALRLAAASQVQITRQRDDFPEVFSSRKALDTV